ncbi:MAG: extracellular solute-binding protein [Anaerolineae bacterium]|nr:extracellular solute-binding protein [Anaerolineae bacterium]
MERLSRRSLLRWLAAGTAGTVLAACGQKAPTTPMVVRETVIVAGTPQVVEKVVTATPAPGGLEANAQLTLCTWEGGITRDTIEAMIKDFTNLTGIKVTHMVPTEAYMDKLQVMVAADQLPEVFYISRGYIADWAEKGQLLDITEQLNSDPTVKVDDIVEANLNRIGGHCYAASVTTEPQVMFYNRDVFDKAGEPYPPAEVGKAWKLDDIIQVARRLTVDVNGRHPGESGFDPDNIDVYGWEWWNWIGGENVWWMNGYELYTGPDLMQVKLTHPEVIEVYHKLSEIPNLHHIAPPAGYYDKVGFGMIQAMARGKIAMITGANWLLPEIVQNKFNVGAAVLPLLGPKYAIWGAGEGLSISAKTKFPAASYKLLSYIAYGQGTASVWRTGLWMPQLKSLLEKEEGWKTWLVAGVHPEEYPTAACIPAARYLKVGPLRKGAQEVWDKWIGPAIDDALFGRKPPEEVLADAEAKANEFLAANPPWFPS